MVQAMGRPVSAEAFEWTVRSGFLFVGLVGEADEVAMCSVPPGCPSMADTTVQGLTELGGIWQSCAPDW